MFLFTPTLNTVYRPGTLIYVEILISCKKVQRRATKLLPNLTHLPYPDRLKILGLYSLYNRCICGDLILTYRILNKHMRVINTFFSLSTVTHTRGHQFKIYKPPLNNLQDKIFHQYNY